MDMKDLNFFIAEPATVVYDVLLGGKTKLKGKWVNAVANIAYPLGDNIFIVGSASAKELKMVKIRVTGEATFDWIEAKYHKDRANYPAECKNQASFSEDCFDGTLVQELFYNAEIVAVPQENKRKRRELSKDFYLHKNRKFYKYN